MRTRVKFCGLTRAEDVRAAVDLGVDAVGFVFHEPSPRYVAPAEAARLVAAVPPFVTTVGLFVNKDADEVRRIVNETGVDMVQFHGDETPALCATSPRRWIKAIRVQSAADVHTGLEAYDGAAGILLDGWDPAVYGGSGRTFDWSLVPHDARLPILLAGGLDAGNVRAAIAAAHPYAVDVSGGIEFEKGKKDDARMRSFMNEVMQYERDA